MSKILYEKVREISVDYSISSTIDDFIVSNLKYTLFSWQEKALKYFLNNEKIRAKDGQSNQPNHLLFQMATGSGKTLVMAALMLYYYKQGYRHFLFFVNQNNIVEKTENNFVESTHSKYLFKDTIVIDGKNVQIQKVDTFTDAPYDLQIKFTTVQKLYNDIHIVKENRMTLDEFDKRDIVMLADESHHLNADTKKQAQYSTSSSEGIVEAAREITGRTSADEIERLGWEHTVIQLILHKRAELGHNAGVSNKNVLLEFTATLPESKEIFNKYNDKIIFRYDLRDFLGAGYTKAINLLSSTFSQKERILLALLFNWYRHKIALEYDIPNFKPVILFRSKTIEESQKDFDIFEDIVKGVSHDDFAFVENIADLLKDVDAHEQGASRLKKVVSFMSEKGISFSEVAEYIKNSFQPQNCIITNSSSTKSKKEEVSEDTERLLNSLEDKNNHIRAIFTVQRLTEGWDVLNLYDIVRMYQGQNAGGSNKKTPQATISEKQLIGRGVRYYPFPFGDKEKRKRKFDSEQNHDLRMLEELFYHTYDEESRYISHLRTELKKEGYLPDDGKKTVSFKLKEEIDKSPFYKESDSLIFYNEQEPNVGGKIANFKDILSDYAGFSYSIRGNDMTEGRVSLDNDEKDIDIAKTDGGDTGTYELSLREHRHIFRKALHSLREKGTFASLSSKIDITSIEELLEDGLLGLLKIKIITNKKEEEITQKEKLEAITLFLDDVFSKVGEKYVPYKGGDFKSKEFSTFMTLISSSGSLKSKSFSDKEIDDSEAIANMLQGKEWYVLDNFVGTSEERALIKYIDGNVANIKKKWHDFLLLRNEEFYKIYDFEQGRGYQPDFLLFLRRRNATTNILEVQYQVFIEPKGKDRKDNPNEKWKEEFLLEISRRYGHSQALYHNSPNYRIVGLPFFSVGDEYSLTPIPSEFAKEKGKNFEGEFRDVFL